MGAMTTVKVPPRFQIVFRGDTEQLSKLRPDVWTGPIQYHLQRLFTGEPVAVEELEHYGLVVVTDQLTSAED